ncbi:MAG: hypothetical protein HYT94_01455, partial [Parcubacteria group bacterium]|nr:hypothetical protein [Parcubacteria group bacterium]
KCTFLIPADPTTGKFNLVSEPTGGSAERVLRLQFCSKWIGRASVVDYYRLNPPAPGGIGGTVSQLGSCFQQNSCNGDDVEDEGGRWNITTIF